MEVYLSVCLIAESAAEIIMKNGQYLEKLQVKTWCFSFL